MATLEEKRTGIINSIEMKKTKFKMAYWILFLVMVLISLICLLPPVWILLSSMKDIKEFYKIPPTILPETFQPEKLIETWNKLKFFRYYINTLELAAGCVVFSVVINGLAGYVLSRLKPKGSGLFLSLMIWTMLMPASLSLVPLFKTMIKFPLLGINLTNTYIPMWLISGASAYFVLIFKGFFDSIPVSLLEAARLDGCGNLKIFYKIIVPLSKPIIAVVSIFTVNGAWGDFLMPYLIIKDPEKYTVMVRIFTMRGSVGFALDIQMIALVFAIIPPVILFLFFQKHIMHGFTLSGIKG